MLYLFQMFSSAQCEESKKPANKQESEMEDLDKIFAENPYAASDPEEMQALLNKHNKNKRRVLPPFQRMIIPLKMLTSIQANDGLKFDINLGLSPKFQLGASWEFSNKTPSNFSLSTMFMKQQTPSNMNSMSFINARKDSTGKMEVNSQYYLTDSISLRCESYFPSENLEQNHVQLELMKECK